MNDAATSEGPWFQRITAAGVPDLVNEIRTQLTSREASELAEQDQIDRQLRIVDAIEWHMRNRDPMLISDATLNQLANQLRQAGDHLTQWTTSGVPEHLVTHSSAQFDAALITLAGIPGPTDAAEAATEVASLRRSVGQHRGQVDREIESLRAASRKQKEQFESQAQQAAKRVSELEAEISRLQGELASITSTARDQANQQQNAFTTAQTDRQEQFSRLLEEKREEVATATEAMKKDIAKQVAHTKAATQSEVQAIEEAKTRVEEILGIVGEEALVGTYSRNADKDRREANRWRWIALAAVAATAGVGIWIVVSAAAPGMHWDLVVAKLALALPIAGAAAYAARQSSEHRHSQREAEHIALQLAALRPYLNDLAEAGQRDQLLAAIAQRLFGQPRRDGRVSGTPELGDSPNTLNQVVALLQELAKLKP